MNKRMTISLFVLWTLAVGLIVSGLVYAQKDKSAASLQDKESAKETEKAEAEDDSTGAKPQIISAAKQKNNTDSGLPNQSSLSAQNASGQTASSAVSNSGVVLSASELAKHNSDKSCWLLISGKIYDVTPFIRQHPGGAAEILQNCGQDATVAFATQGGSGSHSSTARSMLSSYYIGDLNQKAAVQNPSSAQTSAGAASSSSVVSGRDDDSQEVEDD